MNKRGLYKKLNGIFHKVGLDFRRFPTPDIRYLIAFLKRNNINICFDAGANVGQYAKHLQSAGFKGDIYSFEPQSAAFSLLKKQIGNTNRWKAFNMGLGDWDGESEINISKNSVSSSILDIEQNSASVQAAPDSVFISKEKIKVSRLDTFVGEEGISDHFFLKIDAQGFESKILEGAEGCFDNIYALQLELSYVSLYAGEKLFDEMKAFIESRGFYLSSLQGGFTDPKTGRLLQVESIFFRETV